MLLGFMIPVIEMFIGTGKSTYKPPKVKKQKEQTYEKREKPDAPEWEEKPKRPVYFLYRERELVKMKVKELKTILWGKSIGYADLREKKEFVAKIMSVIAAELIIR